ncbi:MAG: fibronectin type III domain-containing protein [Acidimicrobiales bacterium]
MATVSWSPPPAQPGGAPGDGGSAITVYTVSASLGGKTTTVDGSTTTATLAWSPATSNGSPITSCTVAMEPQCPSYSGATVPATSGSATIGGLASGAYYYFAVYATNAVDVGPATLAADNPANGVANVEVGSGQFQVPEYNEDTVTVAANGLTPNTAFSIQFDATDGTVSTLDPSVVADATGSFSTSVDIADTGAPGGALNPCGPSNRRRLLGPGSPDGERRQQATPPRPARRREPAGQTPTAKPAEPSNETPPDMAAERRLAAEEET